MTDTLSHKTWRALLQWHASNSRALPWRMRDPWSVLVAEVLLQRTQAVAVAERYPAIIGEFPTPAAVRARPERWASAVRGLGLRERRQRFLLTVDALYARHSGHVPSSQQELSDLPFVGHYTASAVWCFGYGQTTAIVDANTLRLAGRVFATEVRQRSHRSRAARQLVSRLYPDGHGGGPAANYALLDLAALVCKQRSPDCEVCPLLTDCHYGADRMVSRRPYTRSTRAHVSHASTGRVRECRRARDSRGGARKRRRRAG
jgi:A/G-specific adenine glycosylase